jgi:hypothetical protein
MAAMPQAVSSLAAEPAGTAPGVSAVPVPRPMTRCECASISFVEFARQMAASGSSFEEACRNSRCGQTCTACLPDLAAFLSSR